MDPSALLHITNPNPNFNLIYFFIDRQDGWRMLWDGEVVFVDVDALGWVGAVVHFFVFRKD